MKRALRLLALCAPSDNERQDDRRMRAAMAQAKREGGFTEQQDFDRAVVALVNRTPVPPEIAEWFANEKLAEGTRRSWKAIVFHPAIWAIVIALAVIAFFGWMKLDEQIHAFPGASAAKRLLTVASTTRLSEFEPVQADAGAMGDLFLMKYRLDHYDVPPEFARLRTIGAHVFDDEEVGKVAHIGVAEKRMQFFIFPEGSGSSKSAPAANSGEWNYVEQEGWTGAVHSQNGVCFMAVVRGAKKELAPYLRAR